MKILLCGIRRILDDASQEDLANAKLEAEEERRRAVAAQEEARRHEEEAGRQVESPM